MSRRHPLPPEIRDGGYVTARRAGKPYGLDADRIAEAVRAGTIDGRRITRDLGYGPREQCFVSPAGLDQLARIVGQTDTKGTQP